MIELSDISKSYRMGETSVHALCGVALSIAEGEFVAIMGPSGSGKSTLLHVIGLLDVPDGGSYRLAGREVADAGERELALLRRNVIGFVFQQFHLLPRMTAIENCALPAIYAGREEGPAIAARLLERFGLTGRRTHRPGELSGGQQQRVAIARSLVNGPRLILADEPTGNLDSATSEEILATIRELNREGMTVILVTHEEEIARQARRIIRMRDGRIISDERIAPEPLRGARPAQEPATATKEHNPFNPLEMTDHVRQGFKALAANKVRTGLSMLGILIGVAAVVAMLALGRGAGRAIEQQLSSLGSNLLMVRSGAHHMGGVALEIGAATRLTIEDAEAIREGVPEVVEVAPSVMGRGQLTWQDRNWNTQVIGAGPAYETMRASSPDAGRFFTEEENRQRLRVALLGMTVVRQLLGSADPVGETIKINKVAFLVIGVLPEKGATGWRDQDDVVVIPVLTAMHRLFGRDYIDSIDVELSGALAAEAAQERAKELLIARHRVPPSQQQDAFEVRNMAEIREALTQSSRTMSMLLAVIAAISLLVGGVGIMNIMLVSVTERTREIGLRKAIGACRGDILSQFLAEAMVVSAVGGLAGVMLGWGIIAAVAAITGWAASVSAPAVFLSLIFSAGIGVAFGFYPARKASRLNPIDALRYE